MSATEFDEIRPYHDEELKEIFEELIADPDFREIATSAFPDVSFEILAQKLRACKTKHDFQIAFAYRILSEVARKFTDGLTLSGSELVTGDEAYTYISNHRDIVLDSGFLSILLHDHGMDTVEIAIGDNLFIYPWIKKVVRINKSFIVQRGLPIHQILKSSARMSKYMHYTIKEKRQSIWIAQREGRAKDSNDRTQESLLKMFAMAGEGDIIDRLMEMNLTPLSLSYEYDPCDFLKAVEFQLKRDNPEYKKAKTEDILNMRTGLLGYKGKVHFHIAGNINKELAELNRNMPKTGIFTAVAELINNHIHLNYRMYPGNYIAHDLLSNSAEFTAHYSNEEKQRFEAYIQGQLDKIELPDKDVPYLYEMMLLMYANPLKNQREANHGTEGSISLE